MGLELYNGSLKNIAGKLILSNVYQPDKQACEQFDKQFPFKEKGKAKIQIML